MDKVLIILGIVAVLYGVLMGSLYPCGVFFLVWVVLGVALVAWGVAVHVGAWVHAASWARGVTWGVCAVVLAYVGICCGLIFSASHATAPDGLDYLVVLGAGLEDDGTPKQSLQYRLDAALEYLEANEDTVCVVSGGQGDGEVRTEASAMCEYLVEHGLDEDRILAEDESTSTAENIRCAMELLGEGVEDASAGVVTNNFHVYRAVRIARHEGLTDVYGISARLNPLYLPQSVLRECFAIGKAALLGDL